MAKFKAEFENGTPTYTLTFRDTDFTYSMVENKEGYGTISNNKSFSHQISKAFKEIDKDEFDIETDVDMLDCYLDDTDELFEILDRLKDYE